ncbi:MAG: prepilin-type N-terminal cleavage/methylation domain-containing protein [Chthoniobacterales bacterium]
MILLSLRPKHYYPSFPKAMKAKTTQGFSLTEIIIVILIIGILAAFAFPVFITVQERGAITKDMNNLRQLSLATQRYLNDNDGKLFDTTGDTWMNRLCPSTTSTTRYISDWGVFQSPFDTRGRGATGALTPVSYGINGNSALGIDTSTIINPVAFVLFGSAPTAASTVTFAGNAATQLPGVTVKGLGGSPARAQSNPGGTATGGTQQQRKRISAVCFDGHAENMLWTVFANNACNASDLNGCCRWNATTGCTP